MYASTSTCTAAGIDAIVIRVEARTSNGLPKLDIVGLPDTAVREGAHRVRAALSATVGWPATKRALVNLSPASQRKTGSGFDLAVAVALLAAERLCPPSPLRSTAFVGELGLDGALRPVRGCLPAALAASRVGIKRMVVARDNAAEAALAGCTEVFMATSLDEVVALLKSNWANQRPVKIDAQALLTKAGTNGTRYVEDMDDVRGLAQAKRALEIAAAGSHHLLFNGPPGTGKTMLARRLISIMPDLNLEEALSITAIHSVAGVLGDRALVSRRPLRAPHHTTSGPGLVGGGSLPSPGEVSLAHHGVLFLDELPEFSPRVLNQLRQPLEEHKLEISRAEAKLSFPADFLLVAAMNPCPCGYYATGLQNCQCSLSAIQRYRARVSGPLLDRIDLFVNVPRTRFKDVTSGPDGESSEQIRARVSAARRLRSSTGIAGGLHSSLPAAAQKMLGTAAERLQLSLRAAKRAASVAQTIAALAGRTAVEEHDMAEALQYRAPPRLL